MKNSQSSLDLWTRYRFRAEFLTEQCGSTPADPEVIQAWLKAREPRVKPAGALSIQEINEEVIASIERGEGEADTQFALLVFQRHDGVLVSRAATWRAHLKDCARVLSAQFVGRVQGERAFSTRVINGVYHDEQQYWIPITRPDGTPITKADGTRDKMIHTRGMRGEPINALKRIEYIEPPSIMEITFKVLGRSVSRIDLDHLFTYGGTHGYGGERSDGEGRYTYTLDELEPGGEPAAGERAAAPHARGHRREV
jgi:hypothetical protein